jgi:hypothetical protein
LRTLAAVGREVELEVGEPVTLEGVCDALEASYPVLRGTFRDVVTHQRRPFIRFYACEEDFSQLLPETLLPDAVATGKEPLFLIGAMAGG